MVNYTKYQLFFRNMDLITMELMNLSLMELNIGSIEIIEKDKKENFYLYLPENNEEMFLQFLESFCNKNKINFSYKKIGVLDNSYLTKWKEDFKEIVVENIIVKPSWIDLETEKGKIVVEIDPQTAFGTGHHETTQLGIKSLLQLEINKNKTLLDVGTGSGILSLIAFKKGIVNIVSIDNDFDAVKVAKENFKKNNFSTYNLFCGTTDAFNPDKCFDIVIANIISGILLNIKEDLKNLVADKGILILTGILNEEKKRFVSKFNFDGFFLKNILYLNEWVCFIIQKE